MRRSKDFAVRSRAADLADIWRRYWPVDLLALVLLVVVLLFAGFLTHRQQLADRRAERQRSAICAILASIPTRHPSPAIDDARRVFARHGHPDDCKARPMPSPKPSPQRPPRIVVRPTLIPQPPAPGPVVTVTASPRPHQTPSPTRSPTHRPTHSPSPSPSPTCTLPKPLPCQLPTPRS